MQVLKNSSIAIGLDWTLHDSIADARKALKGRKQVLSVRKVIAGECVQGVGTALPKQKKLQAGAMLVAAAAQDALVYETLGNGQAWVCAIREGIPLHGFDVVEDEESAKATLAEVMSYVTAGDIYGNGPGAKGSLDELFSRVSAADKRSATLSAPTNPVVVLALAAVIMLLAGSALFLFHSLEQKNAGDTSMAMQWQSEEELRRAQQAFQAEVAQARKQFWHARSPNRQFALWYDLLRNLPVSSNGWTPSALTCDPGSCQVSWKRQGRALPSAVAYLPGTLVPQEFKPVLDTAVTSFQLAALESVSHPEGVKQIDQYLLDLGVNVSQFRLVLNPTRAAVTVNPPAEARGAVAETIGQEGVWRASGSNPLLMSGFLQRLELPGVVLNAMAIKNLNLGRSNYTIELEGRYRVGN